jgi:hypothetical protein
VIRLVADGHMSRHFVKACSRLDGDFPMVLLADCMAGRYRVAKDPVLLLVLRESGLILVGFDRRTMAMHAGQLTREGLGHAGVILFRRTVAQMDYGNQARLLVEFWREAAPWDWADRIEYLPRP